MFDIKYTNLGWTIFKDNKPWGIFCYKTEWEAIQELYDAGYDKEAFEFQLLFEEFI